MTHTAGFEDLFFETLAWDADDLMPVGEWLASHMPARVRPPGDCAAYSNYGSMLAGYIVARVSGQPYEQFIQKHILDPLAMAHTTASAIPPDLRTHTSVGYMVVDGVFQAVPDEDDYVGQLAMVPAGAHASSATDMARFMIAHLQGGRYSDANILEARILQAATTQQMHSTLYTPDPRILGTAYGFFEFSDNGQRTLGHIGETLGFNTLLLLVPDQNLGVFVAYNSADVGGLTIQHFGFQRAFFDHYYPASAVEPIQLPADFAERAHRFVGSYRNTRGSYTTLEKVGGLMGGALEISDPGDGTLLVTTLGLDWRFVEVEPLYFRQVDGPFSVVFREDDQGRITHMFTDLIPQWAYEKLNWYETPGFNIVLLLSGVLIFLSMIPVVAIRYFRDRASGDRNPASHGARVAQWIILGISVLNLLFVAGTVLWIDPVVPRFGVSLFYRIVLGLGVLSAALTVGALLYMVLAWKNSYWGIGARTYYTAVTVAAVAFVWFLNYWNLLGWRF